MSSNTDITSLLSTEADLAVDQVIVDSKRLHTVINGTGTEQAVTEDGSLIPSVRKALLDNFYFKTPPLPWNTGSSVSEFNQLYSFTDESGNVTWWYSPGATISKPTVMRDTPLNDGNFRVFLDKTGIAETYAPLVSPDFKGNPRVPLADSDDDTNTIASTHWVKRALESIEAQIAESQKGEFENITVSKDSVIENLYVNGEMVLNTDKLSAPSAEATFNKIRVVGSDAEISFDQNSTPPSNVKTKTNVKPYSVTTGDLSSDSITSTSAKLGDVAASEASLSVDGYIVGDYLHLEGNSRNDATKAQLVVDGVAEIGTLRVTNEIVGIKADVDGLDISPSSVTTANGLSVGKDTKVAGGLEVSGSSKLTDLEVTGKLTGVDLNVDGKTIKPSSISTSGLEVSGVTKLLGDTTSSGKITTKDLEVTGKLTASVDLSGSDVEVDNIRVYNSATIKDLFVTGSTTGVRGDVDGTPITPSSVDTPGEISAGTLIVSGTTTLNGNLELAGEFSPESITTGDIKGTTITSEGDIVQNSGTTRVVNLEVTGTTKGVYADVNGTDISPSKVSSTGPISTDSTLDVAGKSTLGDVEFTGAVTGLDLNLADQNLTVRSLVSTDPSSFGELSSSSITNSGLITTKDIQISGDILDAEGNPVSTIDVNGKDILPNSVRSATFVNTKTLEVEQDGTIDGLLTLNGGVTISAGDITAPTGKATLNDVQVMGSLTDSNGNIVGSSESLKGKDIEPKSVSATDVVTAPRLSSTGDITGQSLSVTGESSTQTLLVGGVSNLEEVRVSGSITGVDAELQNLHIKRIAGTDNIRLTVEGSGEVQGDLNVTGTITGKIDLSSQDVTMGSLQTSGDISGRNISGAATVSAVNGVFGAGAASDQFGLQSLSNARIEDNLQVGGNLVVSGDISGNINLAGKDLSAKSAVLEQGLQSADLVATSSVTTKDLTVTGAMNLGNGSELTVSHAKAGLFTVDPGQDLSIGDGTWSPDGKQSVYNVTLSSDTVINPIQDLSGAGTFYFYIEQDSTGGHSVTFASSYLQIGEETVNTSPGSVSLVQVIYRGKGDILDYVVLRRG